MSEETNAGTGSVSNHTSRGGGRPTGWRIEQWDAIEADTRRRALLSKDDSAAWRVIIRQARAVLRTYSGSFFLVTRFLPPAKRQKVEAVYAALRYPDEIVDTFPWDEAQQNAQLNAWEMAYERGLRATGIREALAVGVPCFLASFTHVVRDTGIPPEHYRAFLAAMRRDICPSPYHDLDDLIDSYVYGSAVVVGYCLAHIYGTAHPAEMPRALEAARDLGIALQLTNFVRDVREDHRRGRLYIPLQFLEAEGISRPDPTDELQTVPFTRAVRRMAEVAESRYLRALKNLDAFAPDTLPAILTCAEVYRRLNQKIGSSPDIIGHRQSVPFITKFRMLPRSKYWRLPLAYLIG